MGATWGACLGEAGSIPPAKRKTLLIQYSSIYTAMLLTPNQFLRIYAAFHRVEHSKNSTLEIEEFLELFDFDRTRLGENLFALFAGGSDSISFESFLFNCWSFCLSDEENLRVLAFRMYDTGQKGILTADDLRYMFTRIFGPSWRHHPNAQAMIGHVFYQDAHGNLVADGMHIRKFHLLCRIAKNLVFEPHSYQRLLQMATLGPSEWQTLSIKRQKLQERGQYDPNSIIALLNVGKARSDMLVRVGTGLLVPRRLLDESEVTTFAAQRSGQRMERVKQATGMGLREQLQEEQRRKELAELMILKPSSPKQPEEEKSTKSPVASAAATAAAGGDDDDDDDGEGAAAVVAMAEAPPNRKAVRAHVDGSVAPGRTAPPLAPTQSPLARRKSSGPRTAWGGRRASSQAASGDSPPKLPARHKSSIGFEAMRTGNLLDMDGPKQLTIMSPKPKRSPGTRAAASPESASSPVHQIVGSPTESMLLPGTPMADAGSRSHAASSAPPIAGEFGDPDDPRRPPPLALATPARQRATQSAKVVPITTQQRPMTLAEQGIARAARNPALKLNAAAHLRRFAAKLNQTSVGASDLHRQAARKRAEQWRASQAKAEYKKRMKAWEAQRDKEAAKVEPLF